MAKEIIEQRRTEVASRQSVGMAGRLERVVLKGFDRIEQYLDLQEADETEELRRHQSDLADRLIKTQVRLDESVLRAESDERFLSVLEQLADAEKLPVPKGKKPEK